MKHTVGWIDAKGKVIGLFASSTMAVGVALVPVAGHTRMKQCASAHVARGGKQGNRRRRRRRRRGGCE